MRPEQFYKFELHTEYDVDVAEALQDVQDTVTELAELGLLSVPA